jgi:hypothetical protein
VTINRWSKKLLTILLAIFMIGNTATSVLAAEAPVYTKTVTASRSLGLALDVGESGTSQTVSFNFRSIPKNAKVRTVTVEPGNGVLNGGKNVSRGLVVFSSLQITSPSMGKTVRTAWNPKKMEFKTQFFDEFASGTWTIQADGSNVTPAKGTNFLFPISYMGAISYKTVKMTISYVLE